MRCDVEKDTTAAVPSCLRERLPRRRYMAIVVSKSQQPGEAKQAKPAEIKITACFVRLITGRVRIIDFTVRAATAGRLRIGGGARHRLSDRLRTGTAPGLPGHVDGN